MRSASRDVPAYYDAFGQPLVNTAGDIFEGLVKKQRLRAIPVTANYSSIPNYLFDLADTLNATAVTIHGKTYPAGTCLLEDVEMPDEPITSKDGVTYWPITYTVTVNPAGWHIILPNKGLNELVYQTRADTASPWNDVSKSTYDAESTPSLKRVIKRRIKDGQQQDIPSDLWLDNNGRAVRVIALSDTAFTGVATTAGSKTISVSGGGLNAETHTGCLVIIPGAGPFGKRLDCTITAVSSSTSATISVDASTSVTGKTMQIPGAVFRTFLLEDLADWSSVPLPNNNP
jgi:hypothetical protein